MSPQKQADFNQGPIYNSSVWNSSTSSSSSSSSPHLSPSGIWQPYCSRLNAHLFIEGPHMYLKGGTLNQWLAKMAPGSPPGGGLQHNNEKILPNFVSGVKCHLITQIWGFHFNRLSFIFLNVDFGLCNDSKCRGFSVRMCLCVHLCHTWLNFPFIFCCCWQNNRV